MKNPGIKLLPLLFLACGSPPETDVTPQGPDTVHVACTAVIGTELLDPEYGFAEIGDICHGPDGSVLVSDPRQAVVRRYTPDGEYIMSYGSPGEGPGELTEPWDITVTESGVLLVSDLRGLNSFDLSTGEWIGLNGDYTRPMLQRMMGGRDSSFTALRSWSYLSDQVPVRTATYGLYQLGAPSSTVFWRDSSVIDHGSGDFIRLCSELPVVATDAERNVYVSESTESALRILRYSPEGELMQTISREYDPVPLTEEERQLDSQFYSLLLQSLGMEIGYTPREYWNTVTSLGVDGHSRIWARSGGGDPPLYRVFDQAGNILFHAVIQGLPAQGPNLRVRISPRGMAAYGYDPSMSFMQVYILETPPPLP